LALSAKIGQRLLLQVTELKSRNKELKTQLSDSIEQVRHTYLFTLFLSLNQTLGSGQWY